MMFFPLLTSVFMRIALASECPSPLKMYVSQDSLVPRPAGKVVLTCVVTGLGNDEVKALWWANEEVNSPGAVLSDSANMDDPHVSHDDFDSSCGTASLLRLNISMGGRFPYSCKLVTHKDVSCAKTLQVRFKDPTIEIKFDRTSSFYDKSHTILSINVTCKVDASYGKPQIFLSYFGSEGDKFGRLARPYTVTNDNEYFFQGSHRELLQLPSTGSIYCRVKDERRVYSTASPINKIESECPDPVTIQVRQPRLAARPADNITMKCVMSGVSMSDIVFYDKTYPKVVLPMANKRFHVLRVAVHYVGQKQRYAQRPSKDSIDPLGYQCTPVPGHGSIPNHQQTHFRIIDCAQSFSEGMASMGGKQAMINLFILSTANTTTDIHEINEIHEDYRTHVLHQERNLTKDGITSIITLHANITNRNTYKCDVKVRDRNCMQSSPVMFEDPKLEISFDENPLHSDDAPDGTVTEVICKIDVASGTPRFTFAYQGEKSQHYGLISAVPYTKTHVFYFSAHSIAIVRLPDAGKVVCRITDSITTYEISKEIIPRVRELNSGKSEKSSIMPYIIPVSIFLVLSILGFSVVVWTLKKGNLEGTLIAEEHEGFLWEWSRITTISRHPQLFEQREPLCTDIQQVNCAAYDSWFLAALNSLCLSYSRDPSNDYFAKIFEKVGDLTASEISIMVWRFGEWKEVQVTATLPSIGGVPYFVHSENKHVFWSALLQKTFGMIRHGSSKMDEERDVHLLEDLSGELVVTYISKAWRELCYYISEHRPLCCWQLVDRDYLFYSITGLRRESEINGEDQIKLREFPYISEKGPTKYSFPREKRTSCKENDEFFIPKTVFQQYFHEYDVLPSETMYIRGQAVQMLEYTDFVGNGHWRQTKSDGYKYYEKDGFWTNPQYLLEFDKSQVPEGQELNVRIVLMQTERWPADFNTTSDKDPCFPLRIGIELFQILESTFHPTDAREHYSTALRPSHFSMSPEVTRKVPCWWSGTSSDRFLVVPFAGGGHTPCDFLLRIHTNNRKALRFKLLPHNEEPDQNAPLVSH